MESYPNDNLILSYWISVEFFFQHISLLQLSQLFSSTILIIIFYKPHQALKEMFLLRNSSAA